MKISKEELWPTTGKLKKTLIILGIVIIASLAMVLLEEQTHIKLSSKVPAAIAFICIGVWLYKPAEKEKV